MPREPDPAVRVTVSASGKKRIERLKNKDFTNIAAATWERQVPISELPAIAGWLTDNGYAYEVGPPRPPRPRE